MKYVVHTPAPPLDMYINALYYLDGSMPYIQSKIVPLPSLDLKINFGGALQVREAAHPERVVSFAESWCVGLWSTFHRVAWPTDLRLFGVNFKPGGASAFFALPIAELHNEVVTLDTLWGHFATEARERLEAGSSLQTQFAILEQLLLARLREVPRGFAIVQYASAHIARHRGAVSMRALSDDIGVSQTYLAMLFKRMVGALPKELARLHRFEQVLVSIDPALDADWGRIAYQSGYYDQSHFNREFREFTGYCPSDYLMLRRQVCDENPEQRDLHRNLPSV